MALELELNDHGKDPEATPLKPGEVRTLQHGMAVRSIPLVVMRATEGEGDAAQDVYEFAFASEEPIETWIPGVGYCMEILGHGADEADLSRLNKPQRGAWRDEHWGSQIGGSDKAWAKDGRSWTRGRFMRSGRAQEIKQGVDDELVGNVSVGYYRREVMLIKAAVDGGLPTYRTTKWMAYHIAFVPDPADAMVGMGRTLGHGETFPVVFRGGQPAREERAMAQNDLQPAGDATAAAEAARAAAAGNGGGRTTVVAPAQPAAATKTRSQEIAEIQALMVENEVPDSLGRDILARELTPDQARAVIGAWRGATAQTRPQPSAERLSIKDARRYNTARALSMAANLIRRDGIELEVSKMLERALPTDMSRHPNAMYIPYRRLNLVMSEDQQAAREQAILDAMDGKRTLEAGAQGKGAELIGPGLEYIDLLRNQTVLGPMGATFLTGLSAPIPFAKKTSAATFGWYGEGKPIAGSDPKFIGLELGPKRLGGYIDASNELLIQSSIDSRALVEDDLSEGPTISIDYGAIFGVGGVEPQGLWMLPAASGIQSAAMGGAPTWAKLTSIPGKTARKNGLRGSLGWVTTPELATTMQGIPKTAGNAIFLWEGSLSDGLIAGYRAMQSAQMRADLGGGANEHALIFGPWNHVIVGLWGAAQVLVDPYTQSLNNVTRFVQNMLGNSICRYPEAFVKGTGATAA